jgi:outer membrane protein assembly factor BamB
MRFQTSDFRRQIGVIVLALGATVHAADWPQWRGPLRDGISSETGLLTSWPKDGPPLLWTANGLGEGYSSVAVAAGRAYTQGQRGSRHYVAAVDVTTGAKVWETVAGGTFNESRGNGPRGTPTVDGARLYTLSPDGTLACLDAAGGKVIWSQNVLQKFRGSVPSWGISESPLVDGDRVIVMPGGRDGSLVALNKADGALVWKSGNEGAGYSSAVIGEFEGVRQIVAMNESAVVGVRADNGQQLWRYTDVSNQTANIATPIVHDGRVFVSTEYESGGALLKVGAKSASEVYFTRNMRNHYSTSVLVDGVLYGFNSSILTAMRFDNGQVLWRHRSVGKGSVAYADKHLYVLGEDAVVALVVVSADGYKEVSRFSLKQSRYPTWAPPVISDGRLYIRNQDSLMAYDVRRK